MKVIQKNSYGTIYLHKGRYIQFKGKQVTTGNQIVNGQVVKTYYQQVKDL